MFEIRVNKNIISVQEVEPLTSGAVSVHKCRFLFDPSWDGFFRSAVFRVGGMVRTVPLDDTDTCDLPWELLVRQNIGMEVEVSVYGAKEETEILPTIWDRLGRVRSGAEPGEDAREFAPGVYDRLVSLIKLYSDKVKGDKGDKGDPGEGDMNAAVYDPQGKKTDIYAYVEDALAAVPDWAMQEEKPSYTADEVGALPSSGGTLTGDLNIRKYDNGYGALIKNHGTSADYGTQLRDYDADGDYVHLQLRASEQVARLLFSEGGTAKNYHILHSGNFSDYAVNKAGDTMTGGLTIDRSGGTLGKTQLYKYNQSGTDYGTRLKDISADGAESYLYIRALDGILKRICVAADGTVTNHDILHTGNKPSGSYTGSGDAAERTIETGGIGSCLLIKGGTGASAIISNAGAIIWTSTGVVRALPNSEAKFYDGVLTLATTDEVVNKSSGTCYYQVL